jgi:hypothetical protein
VATACPDFLLLVARLVKARGHADLAMIEPTEALALHERLIADVRLVLDALDEATAGA